MKRKNTRPPKPVPSLPSKVFKETMVNVRIKRVSDGSITSFNEPVPEDENGKPNPFMWEEGSYSCDCSRHQFWGFKDEIPCGNSRYRANLTDLNTGLIILREFTDGEEQT